MPSKNKLQSRFSSLGIDQVWTADYTHIKGVGWLLSVQSQTTREILFFELILGKRNTFTDVKTVDTLSYLFDKYQKPQLFHTDSDKRFVSPKVLNFLKAHGVTSSVGNASDPEEYLAHHNQVQESSHRVLKLRLRQNLKEHFKLGRLPITCIKLNDLGGLPEITAFIEQALRDIQDFVHKPSGYTTNELSNALVRYEAKHGPNPDLIARAPSKTGLEIEKLKAIAFSEYQGDWVAFFVDNERKAAARHQETLRLLELRFQQQLDSQAESKQAIIANANQHSQELTDKIEKQASALKLMESQLGALDAARREAEWQTKTKEEAKAKRANRTRKPLRNAATFHSYDMAMQEAESSAKTSFLSARDKVSLTLLFITGMRVSNLRELTVLHIKQLLMGEVPRIIAIKKKRAEQIPFYLNETVVRIIEQRQADFKLLIKGKSDTDFAITGENSTTRLDRAILTKRLNLILKLVGKKTRKTLSTHSFRIGLTTSIISVGGVEIAQAIIGHANPQTTFLYSRTDRGQARLNKYYHLALKKSAKLNKFES